MSDKSELPVLVEEITSSHGYRIGLVTLNAPSSLNALTLDMVEILLPQLQRWQEDSAIACVLLRGSGDRAFCAGGDVVALRRSAIAEDGAATQFFEKEYRLDYLIHTYRKPILVWGHGVVMGGGLGLFSGASHRVVTPATRLAMPEVTIGLYPDVGGSWFLNKMPGRTGLFLALTGAAINAGDTLYLGLADRFLQHEQWADMVGQVKGLSWGNIEQHPDQLTGVLRELEKAAGEPPVSVVRDHYERIQAMTGADNLADIVNKITSYNGDDKWLSSAAKNLANGCPISIHLIYQQLRRSLPFSLKEVFQSELVLSANCMTANFAEGVRALLVDKDRQPNFEPAHFEQVTPDMVAHYFQSPWKNSPLEDL